MGSVYKTASELELGTKVSNSFISLATVFEAKQNGGRCNANDYLPSDFRTSSLTSNSDVNPLCVAAALRPPESLAPSHPGALQINYPHLPTIGFGHSYYLLSFEFRLYGYGTDTDMLENTK